MQTGSLELLEFPELKAIINRFVFTSPARRTLEQLEPTTDRQTLEQLHAETAEAIELLEEAASTKGLAIRFGSLPDVDAALTRIAIEGTSLDGKELHDLIQWLDRASELRATLQQTADRYPLLAARAANLADLRQLLKDISSKILPDGSLADHASAFLEKTRRAMDRQREAIQHSLEKFLRAHKDDGVLQDDFVTIRNDRFVIPLIAGQRAKIPGVIHASSGTGATLFVEPMETIALNNELVRLTEQEMREVHRILLEITATLHLHAHQVRATVEAIAALDFTFAKARFARQFQCVTPKFTGRLHLVEARHPILEDVLKAEQKQVVPVSFTIDSTTRTLLITGPNTGGKTVSMKTAGLLALMAQSGIPVPAAAAEFPVFDQVLADIGDNQSIAESLSSFSSHVRQIAKMLRDVTNESLVLLDELGRATDPEEGGSLGVAVLEFFRATGAFTLASTHLMPLKVWGATTEGVLQASMGFNEQEFTPTYILQTGAPGRSAGLAIASKLGLPAGLIDRAKAVMSTSERDIAAFLAELHRRLDEVKTKQRTLAEERIKLDRELATEREQLRKEQKAKLAEIEMRANKALAAFEAQAKETLENITANAASKKAAADALRKVTRTVIHFQEETAAAVAPAKPEQQKSAEEKLPLKDGARCKIKGVREVARIRRLLANGDVEVEVGVLKMRIPQDDILEVLPDGVPEPKSKLPQGITYSQGPAFETLTREIVIIGQRAEEAIEAVDKFIDTASLASVDRVRIVHGHGMGVLKRAVAEHLRNNPLVSRHYPATPAEGGTGATIAELR